MKMGERSIRQRTYLDTAGQQFTGVILWLTVLTAVQPLLGPLHLALADHAHRYNAKSGLYEDIVLHRGEASVSHTASSFAPSLFSAGYSPKSETTYTICPVSNLIHLRYKPSSGFGAQSSALNVQQPALFPDAQIIFRAQIYLTAPKQSPPSFMG